MNNYLKPFVKEISTLNVNGISWVHRRTKIQHITTVSVPLFIADAPAMA